MNICRKIVATGRPVIARIAVALLAGVLLGAPAFASDPVGRAELTKRLVPVTGETSSSVDLSVPFAKASAGLTEAARRQLDELAAALATEALEGLDVAVRGHTDASGSAEYNRKLSQARAAAVVRYLVEMHRLDGDRFRHEGHGEERLLPGIDPNSPRHRRVEIEVMARSVAAPPDGGTMAEQPEEPDAGNRDEGEGEQGDLQPIQ